MTDSQKTYYFLGIGGIGMSALARYFHSLGYRVCGYDRTRTALTRQLEAEGMEIHYEEDINQIPKQLDLVIYTPAIPADNHEFVVDSSGVVFRQNVNFLLQHNASRVDVFVQEEAVTLGQQVDREITHVMPGIHVFLPGIAESCDKPHKAGSDLRTPVVQTDVVLSSEAALLRYPVVLVDLLGSSDAERECGNV